MRWTYAIFFFLFFSAVKGQQQKCKHVYSFNSEITLDSLTVLPSSIKITTPDDIRMFYNPNTGSIFLETSRSYDSVEVCYRVLPFALHKTYMRRDVAEIAATKHSGKEGAAPVHANVGAQREELFPTEGLNKSGSLTRSISFGNAQDLVVNSQLNLQLDGKLTEEINVRASITDQDVPYQPEGNTARVQDFDNVFVQLYNDNFDLIAGHVVLKNSDSYFLKYYKNVQGGLLNLEYKVGKTGLANTALGASVAKGKFASVALDVAEGVAGPYKIDIPDASRLAIILANSEKVFLDGRQLSRGYDYDYVIDYDKAEITFMSKVLITQYSRVRVDVEYSDQDYGRSIFTFNHRQSHRKLDFFVNYYSEKDNRNNPLKYELSDQDKLLLSAIGDNTDDAFKESFRGAEYNPQKIQYELVDTLTLDLQPRQVFRYSANSQAQLYDVTFSEVNFGEGDYIRVNDLVNGVVFQWVSPESGQKAGNYIPARKIEAPVKKSMTNAGVNYQVSEYEKVFTEVAVSQYDKNLFSDLGAGDDSDFACLAGMESKGRKLAEGVRLNSGFSFEKNGRHFTPVDRFRYVEFDRDWNYDPEEFQDASEENILRANIGIVKDVGNRFSYELVKRKRGDVIDGMQHVFDFDKKLGRVRATGNAFLMQNQSIDFSSTWNRLNTDVSYQSKVFVPGYRFSIDRNALRNTESDSVFSTAMNFYEHQVYLKSNDSLGTRFRLDYTYREDQLPWQGEMKLSNIAHTSNFTVNHDAGNHQLEALLTYRKSKNTYTDEDKKEETINARLDWNANILKNHLRSDLSYAVGSGRELKRDFIFIEVPTGQGTHTWRDDNGNGVQERNEFYLAVNPEEKNFAKIFVPTNEYVFAHFNNFSYRLNAEMPRNWATRRGIRSFLSKFSNITSITSQRKITDQSLAARFLPFGNKIKEEDLISSRFAFNSRLFFNRRDPRYGLDVAYTKFENKQFLTGGFEMRQNESWNINFRSNIQKSFSIDFRLMSGRIENASDFLKGKNFNIQSYGLSPELSWQPNVHFRVSGEYSYRGKEVADREDDQYSYIHEGTLSMIYNKATNISINTFFKISNIDFRGVENSPAGYELLEALRPGRNYTWNITLQKKLIAGLQLAVNYEGRKSADYKLVHMGKMQVSVLF